MADVVVDPDGGGDYLSLDAANDGEATDITGGAGNFEIECTASSGSADTTAVSWNSSWICDATHKVIIIAANGDEVVKTGWDISRYRLSVTDDEPLMFAIYISHAYYVDIVGLQIERVYSSVNWQYTINLAASPVTSEVHIYDCRIRTSSSYLGVIIVSDADITLKGWNNIIEGTIRYGLDISAGTHYFWNNVIRDADTYGVNVGASGTLYIENCAVFNNADDFNISGTCTPNYCASDDGDGNNAVAPSGSDWDNEYNDSANGDWTLLNSGNCYHGGDDNPSSGLYTIDIEGDSYNSGAYSIGVDEYVSAGGTPFAIYAYHHQFFTHQHGR